MVDLSLIKQHMAPWFLGDLDSFFALSNSKNLNYPPHNVVKVDDENLILQMALAGIDKDKLSLKVRGDEFIVSYHCDEKEDSTHQWRGISTRNFSKLFKLREDWKISDASLDNGLLEVKISYVAPSDEEEIQIEIK
tara:strand:- start:247 stop:654 length:408 start_codon:yes stop_codon:yes gene_type:complete